MKLLEKDVAKQVKDFLAAKGWRCVRTQFAATPGMFSTGEPGMADYLFLRYMPAEAVPARALAMWVEVKGPNDQRTCRCRPGEKKVCKVCRQKAWLDRERLRGGLVWEISALNRLLVDYEREFGWLHRGDEARGQLALGIERGDFV